MTEKRKAFIALQCDVCLKITEHELDHSEQMVKKPGWYRPHKAETDVCPECVSIIGRVYKRLEQENHGHGN